MALLFTSDPHFGHENVARLRGFDNVEAHDEAITKHWKEIVNEEDHLWILGDLQMSAVKYALELVGSMPGKKHLILGNHDPAHPMHRQSHKFQHQYMEVFESVQAFARRRIAGQEVLLSHFPYQSDHTQVARYTQYRLRDEGLWLLHGHTHGAEKLHGHEIHVGLDAWGMKFVPISTIEKMIKENSAAQGTELEQ